MFGHLDTIWPVIRHRLRPHRPPPGEVAVEVHHEDARVGTVTLTGRLSVPPGATAAVIVQHGLGGSIHSGYVIATARQVYDAGLACLRLNARGSDPDRPVLAVGHTGVSADLRAALDCEALAGFETLYVLGFSAGGHQALRLACRDDLDARLRAVAAISPVLAMTPTRAHLDRARNTVYRRHIMDGLKATWRALVDAGRAPADALNDVLATRTLLEWDRLTVVPYHGFVDVADYDRQACISHHIESLTVPTLVVVCPGDPMIPWQPGLATLHRAPDALETWTLRRGGHVGFDAGTLERVLRWLTAQNDAGT